MERVPWYTEITRIEVYVDQYQESECPSWRKRRLGVVRRVAVFRKLECPRYVLGWNTLNLRCVTVIVTLQVCSQFGLEDSYCLSGNRED
jgi:hypothetical protein